MKLAQIQSEIKAPKGQFNNFGKYKYRSCEDIVEAVKPVLNSHGFCLTITDEVVMIGNRFYVKATAAIWDGTENYSATAYAREEEIKKGMDSAQVTGAASSYARKYALNGLFAIDDTKDADSMDNSDTQKTTLYNHKELGTKEKPLISNLQYKKLLERIESGDYEAGEKAKAAFSFEEKQLSILNNQLKQKA